MFFLQERFESDVFGFLQERQSDALSFDEEFRDEVLEVRD